MRNAIALGTFDGVHIGHKRVLDMPNGFNKIALTFSYPPKMFFANHYSLITLPEDKAEILKKLGIDEVITLDFEDFKDVSAEDFLSFLKKKYNPAYISCGYDYRFGKDGKGDCDLLKEFCEKEGIELFVAESEKIDNKPISSSIIREMLKNGEIKLANSLLTYPFSYSAKVIHGDERGRKMGFPTINQKYPEMLVDLKFGVYKTRLIIDEKEYFGITNIGIRPTYLSSFVISETHILDFSGDLYGKNIRIYPTEFLREEMKFSSFEELKQQILIDLKR